MALASDRTRTRPKRLWTVEPAAWLPPLLSLLLAAPCFRFTFLFDDFDFLSRGRQFAATQLLPDPGSAFYRPLSRELFFAFLARCGGLNPVWGHALNAAAIALTVVLTTRFASRVAGDRAGLYSGLFLALIGPIPFLVGWISGIQDALAMALLMAALNCRLLRHDRWAIALSAAALLSKETAICLFPAIIALPSILDGDHVRTKRSLAGYLLVAFAWAAVNPEVRALIERGTATGTGGYIGLDNPGGLENLGRMAFALLNVPERMEGFQRISVFGGIVPLALAVVLIAVWVGARMIPKTPERGRQSHVRGARHPFRVVALGALMTVVPALATALWVKHWAPYYACIPALGMSLVFAFALERLDVRVAGVVVMLFLFSGLLCRAYDDGGRFGECERTWGAISSDLAAVQRGMKSLLPTIPAGERVYVSIHLPIERRVHSHLLHYQAPRVWYGRPDIEVLPAGRFDPGARPSVILWISPSCEVSEIDFPSLRVRSGRRPVYEDYQRALRLVALGVFRAGDVEKAARMILGMSEPDSQTCSFDRRLAAAFYLTVGKRREAANAIEGLPPVGRFEAMNSLVALLGPAGSRENLGPAALQAYGLSANDPEVWRCLMHAFLSAKEMEPAWRMARQVRALLPGDAEAGRLIDWVAAIPRAETVTVSAGGAMGR